MILHSAARTLVGLALAVAPLVAQAPLGPYSPTAARYRITSRTGTTQSMMGQSQEFESTTNQLMSMSVAKAGDALTLTMVLDSATVTTTAPDGAPDLSAAIGLRFAARMALDGKVASSEVTDKSGAVSTSPFAGNMRSILPRLMLGASTGVTWVTTDTSVTKQNDAEITTATVVTYSLAGDTTVAGAKAWKIVGSAVGTMNGAGNRMGSDYTIAGDVKSLSTSLVSATGILLGITSDATTNLVVTVPAAGMTIPILQKTTTTIAKLP